MPYPSALSGADQIKYRNGTRSTRRYTVAHTPTVIFQFNPSANADGTSASQIPYSAMLDGAYTDVLQYMTVYVTPTTDYVNDLQTQPENCLRTYARKDPTSAILYIGLTAFQWTTASYVTVVDNFEIFEKHTVIVSGVIYKDSEIGYRAPLPRITGNYHRIVMTSGSAEDVSPTPTETAMASGESISSRTWAVIENGVVTKAVSTSATPTFNLDIGTHWLHLTTTDSNGNSNVSVAFVAIVPDDYSSVVSDFTIDDVSNSLENGLSASITAVADTGSQISTLVPGVFGMVFAEVVFTDNTKAQHVEMCGWFDAPVQIELAGDEQFGIRKGYSTQLIGVKGASSSIRIPGLPFKHNSSPSTWGQVARCTVYDAIWYTLSEHSAIAHVASIEFPSNYTDYQFNPALQVPQGTLMDSVENQAFRASGGLVNYAPHGELVFAQSAIYATSGRDALTTYATYDAGENDAMRYAVTRPPVNRFALSSVQAGFALWNTTTNLPRVYRSIAPANQTPAALFEQLDSVIMTKNLSHTNALIESGKLAANHFFAANESLQLDVDFVDGYLTIVPSAFQWHKFNVPATVLLDGSSFDSNTRFLCTSVSIRYDVELGRFVTTGTFREETDGGDNYARETEFVPSSNTQVTPVYPEGTFSPFLDEFDVQSADDTYGDGFNDANSGIQDPTLPPEVADDNIGNNPGVLATVYVPLTGGVVGISVSAGDYLLRVSGFGYIALQEATQVDTFSVAANNENFTSGSATLEIGKTYRVVVAGDVVHGGFGAFRADAQYATTNNWSTHFQQNNIDFEHLGRIAADDQTYDGVTHTYEYTIDGHGAVLALKDFDLGYTDNSGSYTITIYEVFDVYADAIFYTTDGWETTQQAPNTTFLYLDSAAIPELAALEFNSAHVYEAVITWGGGTMPFSYTDSWDASYVNNQNTVLKVEIIAV